MIFRTSNWEDFVHLAFNEIRFYVAGEHADRTPVVQ
jgi:hypothetical protein